MFEVKDLSWLRCSELRERFVDKRMTMKGIGEEFGISAYMVGRRLRECQIIVQDKYELPINCSELRAMYDDGKMNIWAIAKELDVRMLKVSYALGRCGIEKRTHVECIRLTKKLRYIDPTFLKWLYEDRKMSTTEIGRFFGIGQTDAWRKLKAIGVEMRARGSEVGRRTYKPLRLIDGDMMVYMPEHERSSSQGYVKLRLLAYEKLYGALPPKGDVIHIIDGNLDNLSRKNLRVMTNSEHSKFHCFANYRATGNAWKPCPKDQLAKYMKMWDEEKKDKNVN